MSDPPRLKPERESDIRDWTYPSETDHGGAADAPLSRRDVRELLGEIDYLRGQVQAETHHASELKRQLAGQVSVPPRRDLGGVVSGEASGAGTSAGWSDDA